MSIDLDYLPLLALRLLQGLLGSNCPLAFEEPPACSHNPEQLINKDQCQTHRNRCEQSEQPVWFIDTNVETGNQSSSQNKINLLWHKKLLVTVPVFAAPEGCWPPLVLCDTDPPTLEA